jgi:hypothetical protein
MNQPLPPLPDRMQRLARDHRGFPVPWFVQWLDPDGKPALYGAVGAAPDFRIMDSTKLVRAVRERRCWVCGETLGRNMAFTIGPMCVVNRTTAEPPSHLECAEFSAKGCPFLTRPKMRRNEKDMPEHKPMAGFGLKRNPGATCIWVTREYSPFRVRAGAQGGGDGVLFRIGEPVSVHWYAEGRQATREEVMASIESGMPALLDVAHKDHEPSVAVQALHKQYDAAMPLLPVT